MKKRTVIFCLLAFALAACKPDPEPEPMPNDGGQNNDTTETVVKKYLVKEYFSDPDQPERIIEWEDGFERIKRIVTKPGNPMYEVAYNFEYFNDDSLRVEISLPEQTAFWIIGFSSFTAYLSAGKIAKINYFRDGVLHYTEEYNYDDRGRLISVLNNGEHPHGQYYKWDDENVVEIRNVGGIFKILMISVSTSIQNILCRLSCSMGTLHNMVTDILPSRCGKTGENGMEYVNMT